MYIENITKTMRDYIVEKQDNKTVIKVILPGVEREDINISVCEEEYSTLVDEQPIQIRLEDFITFTTEYKYTSPRRYKYNINVKCEKLDKEYNFGSNSNDISAELKLGVLTIEIKGKKKESKQIEIK
jgi:HSP20 family molecular chaperone IbpA